MTEPSKNRYSEAPEVEILENRPLRTHKKTSFWDSIKSLRKRPVLDSRLFRFIIIFLIASQGYNTSIIAGYFIGAAVYGWIAIDDSVRLLQHRIPKKLYLMLTLKKVFYFLILALLVRFMLGILIGWLVMPLYLILSIYQQNRSQTRR